MISEMQRYVPGTDQERYDIAYKRGRRQTRSALVFGGLFAGLVMGALGMFLLDPDRGKGRRAEIRQRATSASNDMGRAAEGKAEDLRNRATGLAHETGLAKAGTATRERPWTESERPNPEAGAVGE
jgi:hypothetical protein